MINKKKSSAIIVGIALGMIVIILIVFFILRMINMGIIFSLPIIFLSILVILIINFKPKKSSAQAATISSEQSVSYEEVEGLPSDMMRCSNCNNMIPKGLTFCPECGERISPEGLFE